VCFFCLSYHVYTHLWCSVLDLPSSKKNKCVPFVIFRYLHDNFTFIPVITSFMLTA
jgi:hypothetical protein